MANRFSNTTLAVLPCSLADGGELASGQNWQPLSGIQNRLWSTDNWPAHLLSVLLAVVLSVSIFDIYCSYLTQEVLVETEQNPIGTLLIQLGGGSIHLFMACKSGGNILVLFVVTRLFQYKTSWGLTTASGLAVFQMGLFCYLNWGHLVVPPQFA